MLNIEGLIYRRDIQNGRSFVNDLKIYEWPEFHDTDGEAFITECDWHGEPLPENMLMFYYRSDSKGFHFSFHFPKEILNNADHKKFIQQMKDNEKKHWSEKVNRNAQ